MSPSRKASISRSRSASIVVPIVVATPQSPTSAPLDTKRNHSQSISSVSLIDDDLNNIIQQDSAYPYRATSKGKIHLMGNADLEKQIILTAGGKREYVCGFLMKLLFLTLVVLGCSVLIFYAL